MPSSKKPSKSKQEGIEPYLRVWAWILLCWSIYRYLAWFPEWVDELLFKPLIFVAPVLWYVRRQERKPLSSLGFTLKNFPLSLGIGMGFGLILLGEGIIVNFLKNGSFLIRPIEAVSGYGVLGLIGLTILTALWEETLSRGFLFQRIYAVLSHPIRSALFSTMLFVLLHVPILVTTLRFHGPVLILYFLTNFIIGFVNSMLMLRTGSLIAPILVHIFWNMTVALFL